MCEKHMLKASVNTTPSQTPPGLTGRCTGAFNHFTLYTSALHYQLDALGIVLSEAALFHIHP